MDTFTPRLEILPAAQRQLWPELRSIQHHGFVLYGGTAIALRLGHRQSVDFDFFSAQRVDAQRLRAALPFVKAAAVRQESSNTLEVETQGGVKVAFFGGLELGRVGRPQRTTDGVLRVASLEDLMATKVKVILQRSEAKDYRDIAAMVRAGVRLETGLAAAEKMFQPTFPPSESLKALVYFEGGDMARLSVEDRVTLTHAVARVKSLPAVTILPGLVLGENLAPAPTVAPSVPRKIIPPRRGPRMGF